MNDIEQELIEFLNTDGDDTATLFAYYPMFDVKTARRLQRLQTALEWIFMRTAVFRFVFPMISGILNIFHTYLLAQKSMRSSSTNAILAGISTSETVSMVSNAVLASFDLMDDEKCFQGQTFLKTVILLAIFTVHALFQTFTASLATMLAAVRALILRNAMNARFDKLSDFASGWVLNVIMFCICLPVVFAQFTVIEWVEYVYEATEECPTTSPNATISQWGWVNAPYAPNSFYDLLLNSHFSRLAPLLVSCALQLVLYWELRKATRMRRKQHQQQHRTVSIQNERNERSTRLVAFTTGSFLVVQCPLTAVYLVQNHFGADSPGIQIICVLLGNIFRWVSTLNALVHVFFCYFMSTQYRETADRVFPILKVLTENRKRLASEVRSSTSALK